MSLARALESGDLTQLPSRRDEDWRWSDLRGLIREAPPPSPAAPIADFPPFGWAAEHELLVVNGRVTPPGGQGKTLAIRFISNAEHTAHAAQIALSFKAGTHTVLLESYEGRGEGYVADYHLDLRLEAGASVERIVIADEVSDAIVVSHADVILGAGSRFAQTLMVSGAKRQRFETHIVHPGAGASVRLDGAYLVADRRHGDLTTVVRHAGQDGTTDQLVKGAVAGQGRGVFQGRIVVEPGADKTDARMGHHALILGDAAEVDSKPELMIYADDVACAHGNTVGQLDEAAIFYARQRGIPLAEARAMLTEAFVGEVVYRIEYEPARDVARAWVSEHLKALADV